MTALVSASPAVADDVDRLFTEGTAALEAGKLEAALRAFQSAWKLRNTHDIAANLAQAELALGRHRDAAEHLAFALRSFPVTGKAEVRKQIEAMLTEQKKKVLTVAVSVKEAGADVWIDGARVGAAPLGEAVFVEPGKHTLEVRLDGYVTDKRDFEGAAGEKKTIEVTLSKRPEVAPPASATATVVPAPRSTVPVVVTGGGLALVAAGLGVGLVVGGGDKGNAALKMSEEILDAGRSCVAGAANQDARCETVKNEASAADTMNHAGIGLLISGGVIAAGALAYWWLAPRDTSKAQIALVPLASPTGGGAVLRGSF